MRLPVRHRWIHALLALLLFCNGMLAAAQASHHASDAHAVVEAKTHGDHCRDHYQPASIDSGSDEHGHCFHVHLPAHALVSYDRGVDVDATSAGIIVATPQLPVSLAIAPPVPPPNA
jgi:hypothetical protein